MATNLSPYNFQLPEIGGDNNQWGDITNNNWGITSTQLVRIDDALVVAQNTANQGVVDAGAAQAAADAAQTSADGKLSLTGGTLTDVLRVFTDKDNTIELRNTTSDQAQIAFSRSSGTINALVGTFDNELVMLNADENGLAFGGIRIQGDRLRAVLANQFDTAEAEVDNQLITRRHGDARYARVEDINVSRWVKLASVDLSIAAGGVDIPYDNTLYDAIEFFLTDVRTNGANGDIYFQWLNNAAAPITSGYSNSTYDGNFASSLAVNLAPGIISAAGGGPSNGSGRYGVVSGPTRPTLSYSGGYMSASNTIIPRSVQGVQTVRETIRGFAIRPVTSTGSASTFSFGNLVVMGLLK